MVARDTRGRWSLDERVPGGMGVAQVCVEIPVRENGIVVRIGRLNELQWPGGCSGPNFRRPIAKRSQRGFWIGKHIGNPLCSPNVETVKLLFLSKVFS